MGNRKTANEPKKKHHIAARIVCLLLAFVIWLVVAGVQGDNYKREIRDVKVTLVGAESLSGYEITDYTKSMTVTVKGDHSKVTAMTSEDITVLVDVSAVKGTGDIKVPATVQLSPKLERVAPYGEYFVTISVRAVPEDESGTQP